MRIERLFRIIYLIDTEKPDTTTFGWYIRELIYIYLIPFIVAFIAYHVSEYYQFDTNTSLTLMLLIPTGLVFLSYFYLKSYQ